MLSLEAASSRDVSSLQNWLDGNGCLARQETAYLSRYDDLLTAASPGDQSVTSLEAWVEVTLVNVYRYLRKVRTSTPQANCRRALTRRQPLSHEISRDPHVHIFSGSSITTAARVLVACVTVALLLAPSIICITSDSITTRILVIIMATILFIAVLACLARARTVDMFVAGAT